MLKHPKSKVIVLDTRESEMMYDLLFTANDVFKTLREKAGRDGEISVAEATDIILKFQNTLLKTSDILSIVAESIDYPYHESIMFAKLRDTATKGKGSV